MTSGASSWCHDDRMRYPVVEPFDSGVLEAGGGQQIYWERTGSPHGKPAVVLHGGPGSGAAPWWRTYFDPDRYCVTLFDQRGCGRSRPLASEPGIDLSAITTQSLINDIEALRGLHGVDHWLVFGGSWGSTLGLAYAVEHPSRVSELVPGLEQGGNLPVAYNSLLMSPDAGLRDRAARSWCAWEDRLATLHGLPKPSPRYANAAFRLGFARLVTHFFGHHAFLPPDGISSRTDRITCIPAVFVRGRLDIASPLGVIWRLAQQLPLASLHVVEDENHGGGNTTDELLVQATNSFAD